MTASLARVPGRGRRTARLYAPVVLGLLGSGGLAYFAASRTWARTTVSTAGLPTDSVSVTGADAYPLVPALSLVVVGAALGIVATGGRVRRIIAVLTAVVALVAAWVMLDGNDALEAAIADAVRESPSYTDSSKLGEDRRTIWDLVTLLGLGLAAALAAVVLWLAPSWPTMGGRFEAPATRKGAPETEAELWSALDEGRDPTE